MWAFATSPHGLGLSSEVFWCLRMPEYLALKKIYDAKIRRWAIEQATLRNAHLTDGVPWTPDDFLGKSDRQKRIWQHKKDQQSVQMANFQLSRIVAGAPPPPDTPEWAIGEYRG